MSDRDQTNILEEAHRIIHGQRQQDYGDKLINFTHIANLWEATLAIKLRAGQHITPEDVALCMIQVKLARLVKSPSHRDSLLDIAGYAGCYEILQKERATGTSLPPAFKDFGSAEWTDLQAVDIVMDKEESKDNVNPSKS